MLTSPRRCAPLLRIAFALCAALAPALGAQGHITTPKEALGANFGDDYFLASYRQIAAYWRKLERESGSFA